MATVFPRGASPHVKRDGEAVEQDCLPAVALTFSTFFQYRSARVLLCAAWAAGLLHLLCCPPVISLDTLLGRDASPPPVASTYSVVVDAGSTGTRVHVYRFDARSGGLLSAGDQPEVFQSTTPGLSSCATSRTRLRSLLKPLLDAAAAAVPLAQHSRTPVTVRATAGLRLLPPQQAAPLLDDVRALVAEYQFHDAGVEIMSGGDEGAFQWLAVNTLLGSTSAERCDQPAVVLELGGASLQVAYGVRPEALAAVSPALRQQYIREMTLPGGCEVPMYQHSYLGYGVVAARAKMFEEAEALGIADANPCLLGGWKGNYSYGNAMYAGSGAADAAGCARLVEQTLRRGAPCGATGDGGSDAGGCSFAGAWAGPGWDPADLGQLRGAASRRKLTIAACSAFFDGLYTAGAAGSGRGKTVATPRQYAELAAQACAAPASEADPRRSPEAAPWVCFDLTYVSTLLTVGLGLAPDRELLVAKELSFEGDERRRYSATWPLGVAMDGRRMGSRSV